MKVRCIVDDELSLTKGKIYEVLCKEHGLWSIVDDEEECSYLYSPQCFEVVEEDYLDSVSGLCGYMQQFIPGGNFEEENLESKLKAKKLTHEEFNGLCENLLNFLEYGRCPELEGNLSDVEQVVVMTAEQGAALMPLTMYEYDAINKFDKWQEMYGDDDIPELDDAVNEIFCNAECRKLVEKYARKGEYLELAEDIGIKI